MGNLLGLRNPSLGDQLFKLKHSSCFVQRGNTTRNVNIQSNVPPRELLILPDGIGRFLDELVPGALAFLYFLKHVCSDAPDLFHVVLLV